MSGLISDDDEVYYRRQRVDNLTEAIGATVARITALEVYREVLQQEMRTLRDDIMLRLDAIVKAQDMLARDTQGIHEAEIKRNGRLDKSEHDIRSIKSAVQLLDDREESKHAEILATLNKMDTREQVAAAVANARTSILKAEWKLIAAGFGILGTVVAMAVAIGNFVMTHLP